MQKRIIIKTFLVYSLLIYFSHLLFSASIKSVASGIWNSTSTWDTGNIPTSVDDVIIQKGHVVYIDTQTHCVAGSLTLDTAAEIQFLPDGVTGSSLTVYGAVSIAQDASVSISPTEPNSVVYFESYRGVTVDGSFSVLLTTSAYINLIIPNLIINGSFSCIYADTAGNINLDLKELTNSGEFYIGNFTSTVRTINIGYVINTAVMRFVAVDPNPANTQKPDPENVERKLKLVGYWNDSYLITIRSGDYTQQPVVGLELSNVEVKNVGIWQGVSIEGDPLYGIGFIGKKVPIDGSKNDFITIYNCDIHGSADTGIFYKNCVRMNEHWGQVGISSSIIRNCTTAGVWFIDKVEKCDIRFNKIYNNWGGNIGYGIVLGDIRATVGEQAPEQFYFNKENNIYKNEVYNNKIRGIYLLYSHRNLIDSNKCYGHLEEGISLKNSIRNTIILNECYNNGVHGIALDGLSAGQPTSGSKQNYIANNKLYNNNNSGLRVRYNSNQNIFVNNISTGNARAALTSHSSIGNLFVNETYYDNGWGDVYIEGEQNLGYVSQLWLKNCLLGSPTEFVNTPEKQEFTKQTSYVYSECHDRTPGLVRIWGEFVFPDSYHTWHTNDTLKFNYYQKLYESKSHGWNSVVSTYDTPMLRYDDGGIDGPNGSNDITSVTISTSTKTEVWIVTYDALADKWIARGTVSGVQTKLVVHDTDYESDGGEVKFRITHRHTPVSPGEQYVFVTIAGSQDENTQKIINLCDFSDPLYIGASFTTQTSATLEIVGISTSPVVFTRKLAEDKVYQNIAGTQDFYYGVTLGGTINRIEYASFTFLNSEGLKLVSSPLNNTKNVFISRIQPSQESAYITTNGVNHTFDNVVLDTTTATLGVITYNVKSTNSMLTFRNYTRPFLPDKLENSVVYWEPMIVWSGLKGFESDGVEPNNINRLNSVEFTIKYIDLNNTPPTTVQVWVDLDDNLIFSSTEQFGMMLKPGVGNDGDYTNGEIYHFVLTNINYPPVPSLGRSGGKIKYRFYAENPYSLTVATYTYNLYSIFNNVLSLHEATGVGTQISTFSVKGTPPVVQIQTPVGEQTDLVRINYTLFDYDDKPEPYNYCSVKVEYFDGTAWKTATKHDSSEPLDNLVATLNGTQHYFIWDSRKDLPNKDMPTKIRITPKDEDGEGSAVTSASFQVDNIVATQLVFTSAIQQLKIGATSQVMIIEAQDEVGNKDVDINATVYLVSTSTTGVFLNLSDVIISSVTMISGEARFKYRDNTAGSPVITAMLQGLSPAQQVVYVTKFVSVVYSSVNVLVAEEVKYAELPVGTTVTIVVTLKDTENIPVPDKEVVLYTTGSDYVLSQPQSPTNSEGKTYATLFTTKAEQKIVTARVKDENILLVSSATINFYAKDVSEEVSTISVSKTKAVVGERISIVVTLKDKYGNIISSASPTGSIPVTITIKNQPAEDVLVMISSYTDINGQVRAEYTGNVEGIKIITAATDKVVLLSTATVEFVSGDITPPTVVSITPQNNSVVTESISRITVELQDDSGISSSSTTIKLFDPNGNIVNGTLSVTGNTFVFNFPSITIDGQYRIELTAVDTKGNSQTYVFYFNLQTKDPQKVFTSSVLLYPNPSNTGKTTIRYSLLNDSEINIKIYNILGELIWEETFNDTAGNDKEFEWRCENVDKKPIGTGVYVIYITVKDKVLNKNFSITKKQVVIKNR